MPDIEKELCALSERINSNRTKFPNRLSNTTDEVCVRLNQLSQMYAATCHTNMEIKLKNPQGLKVELRVGPLGSGFDEVVYSVGGQQMFALKVKRKDLDIPITLHNDDTADTASLLPAESDPALEGLEATLAAQLESFYFNAYKIWNLCSHLNGSNLGEIGVLKVRNHLIQHPEKDSIYSIGSSQSHGPSIKPSKKSTTSPKKNYHDAGLIANTREFIGGLNAWLEKIEHVCVDG